MFGIWHIESFDKSIRTISNETPLYDFARCIIIKNLHEDVPVAIERLFKGTLIGDQATWASLNKVLMNLLGSEDSLEPIVELGLLVPFTGNGDNYWDALSTRNSTSQFPSHTSPYARSVSELSRSTTPESSITLTSQAQPLFSPPTQVIVPPKHELSLSPSPTSTTASNKNIPYHKPTASHIKDVRTHKIDYGLFHAIVTGEPGPH